MSERNGTAPRKRSKVIEFEDIFETVNLWRSRIKFKSTNVSEGNVLTNLHAGQIYSIVLF